MHRDPQEYLAEAESKMDVPSGIPGRRSPHTVGLAAKAALEAGALDKAAKYATEAIETAILVEAKLRRTDPGRFNLRRGIPEGYFFGNFVLGRIAVLNGDIRGAEKYLLASGNIGGGTALSSYGPNLSLALELLKNGDDQSRETVIRFIQEIRTFWKIAPTHFDTWIAAIESGKIPDFQATGSNLYN